MDPDYSVTVGSQQIGNKPDYKATDRLVRTVVPDQAFDHGELPQLPDLHLLLLDPAPPPGK